MRKFFPHTVACLRSDSQRNPQKSVFKKKEQEKLRINLQMKEWNRMPVSHCEILSKRKITKRKKKFYMSVNTKKGQS